MIWTWDYGEDASPDHPVFMWDEPTVVVKLRPRASGMYLGAVDVHRNTSELAFYSDDGVAGSLEFLDTRVDLSDTPCRVEVERVLIENGIEVVPGTASPPTPGDPRRASSEILAPLALERHQVSPHGAPGAIIRFRVGEPDYSYDFVGDGTVIVGYSYDGLAVRLEVSDTRLSVPVGRLPCSTALRELLATHDIPISNSADPARVRPWLENLDRTAGSATIQLCSGGNPSEDLDIRGDGSVYVVYSDSGLPMRVHLTRISPSTNLEGLPYPERVAAILEHQNLRVAGVEASPMLYRDLRRSRPPVGREAGGPPHMQLKADERVLRHIDPDRLYKSGIRTYGEFKEILRNPERIETQLKGNNLRFNFKRGRFTVVVSEIGELITLWGASEDTDR